jgi:hypothetical protein
MDTTRKPIDLDAVASLVKEQHDLVEAGDYDMSDWSHRAVDTIEVLVAEVRRMRTLQEDTAAENARLSAWWHAMRRGGLA